MQNIKQQNLSLINVRCSSLPKGNFCSMPKTSLPWINDYKITLSRALQRQKKEQLIGCVIKAAENAHRLEEDDSTDTSDEEDGSENDNDDGTLPETEREALRKIAIGDDVIDCSQDSGDELEDIMEGEQNSIQALQL